MHFPANIYMQTAIELATKAGKAGEVPVGAVVVDARNNRVIATAHNETEQQRDPTAHAEMLALREALRILGEARLSDCDLYVTLEPCAMCAGAIAHARIRRVVFGAYDPKSGGVEHGPRVFTHATTHHKPEIISGVEELTCSNLLKEFFQNLR